MSSTSEIVGPEWLTSLYNNSLKSDIEILVTSENGPPARFSAHSFVLIHQSVVFEKMLEPGKFLEGVTGRVTISDVKPFVFQYILRFLYTSELPEYISFSEILDLIKAAHFYQLHNLQKKCISRLRDFSVTEVCKVYEMSVLLDLPEELKSKCLVKMIKKGPLILKNDLHFELSESSLQSMLVSKFWNETNPPTSDFNFQAYNNAPPNLFGARGFVFDPYPKPPNIHEDRSCPASRISVKEVGKALVRWAQWQCIKQGKELNNENLSFILTPLRPHFPEIPEGFEDIS